MASLIHGHAHPAVVAAVTEQLHRGTAFTLATEIEVRFAEHMIDRSESFEMLRFVNSGTEAVMACVEGCQGVHRAREDRKGGGGVSRAVRLRRGEPDGET